MSENRIFTSYLIPSIFILISISFGESIGDRLFKIGLHESALTEYKRDLFSCQECDPYLIKYKIAQCYFNIDQLKESEKILLELINNCDDNIIIKKSLLLLCRIHWEKYQYEELRHTLNILSALVDTSFFNDIKYLAAWSYIYEADWEKAVKQLKQLDYSYKDSLINDVNGTVHVVQKSTINARYLSYIIPGTGQAYNKDYRNAIYSFLLVGSIEASIIYDIISRAYVSALFKYMFLFTRYSRGSRYIMESNIARKNVDRMGDYLASVKKKYPDPMKVISKLDSISLVSRSGI